MQIVRIYDMIQLENWQGLCQYLDEMISKESQESNMEKSWLTDYQQEKIAIIKVLEQRYEKVLMECSQYKGQNEKRASFQLSSLEECIIKLFSKGLLIQNLRKDEDIRLLKKVIEQTENQKYMFMLYQENVCQVKTIYDRSYCTDVIDKVLLKLLYVVDSFIQKLIQKVIFKEVVEKVNDFYVQSQRMKNESNIMGKNEIQIEDMKEINEMVNKFINNGVQSLEKLLDQKNLHRYISILRNKPIQRYHLFTLIKLIYNKSKQSSQSKLINIVNKFISNLNIPFIQIQNLPSFWIVSHLFQFITIYNPKQTLFFLGTLLLNQLPTQPQYTQIQHHLLPIILYVCQQLYHNTLPFHSLSLKKNPQFITLLFQRFSILMGLFNKLNQNQNHILIILNAIFNKKSLFSSPVLPQTLWRTLIHKHQDINFKIFAMSQYKKVLILNPKQIYQHFPTIISHAYKSISKQITELEPNSNPEFIGFHVTLTIYLISCINKLTKYFTLGQGTQLAKHKVMFHYFFNQENVRQMKLTLKKSLTKLKQGLQDRLQVYKMKTQSTQINEKQEKQVSEISICIYRIQKEINFE